MINQIDTSSGVTTEANVNLSNDSMYVALDIGNNVFNSENNDNNADTHEIHESNNNTPISTLSSMLLPCNFNPTFPDIASKKEDN